jgi:hypothetical protein
MKLKFTQKNNNEKFQLSYKQFSEMTEALAERLLDLHCRLLTLYIIQGNLEFPDKTSKFYLSHKKKINFI